MTLSSNAQQGTARLVSCTADIEDAADLVTEAKHLWAAESLNPSLGGLSAKWGCCGILIHNQLTELRNSWREIFRESVAQPIEPVSDGGELRMPWPVALGPENIEVDVLLATATRAEHEPPSVTEIAEAWIAQHDGEERYFFNNVRSGIRTPQDLEIWNYIESKKPEWIQSADYSEAIETLNTELASGV